MLTGELDGHQVTRTLDRIDPASFPQRSTPFRWMQNRPNFRLNTGLIASSCAIFGVESYHAPKFDCEPTRPSRFTDSGHGRYFAVS